MGLTGLLSLAIPMAQAGDYIPFTSFATDPTSAGWTKSGPSASWTSGYLDCADHGWYSPIFSPTPGEYYKIQYDAKLKGSAIAEFAAFFANPLATYDLEPLNSFLYRKTSTGENYVSGQLLADNYTSIKPAGPEWTTITEFTRAPVNSSQSFILFGKFYAGGSALINNVTISPATHAEVRAWADSIYDNPANFPTKLAYTPPADRFAALPKTLAKLTQGKTLSVVLIGDSIMGDTENSPFDVLIERNFPGCKVVVHSAVGHGTGMNAWLNAASYDDWQHTGLKLQEAVYDRNADLVILGGISNGSTEDRMATIAIVQELKRRGTEVLLNTGCFGSRPGPNFIDTINGTTTGTDHSLSYRNWMYSLARDEGVGFFDSHAAWVTYLQQLKAAGMTEKAYYRDFWTHGNTVGKNMIGRLYEAYFTPPLP